jgi:hypothetical protein
MRPDDADIGIKIDFERGSSDPVRVFTAMTEMLSAFDTFDALLFHAVDPQLRPAMVLEDVESGSMTSWVRNKLEQIDDGALKEFSIKQQLGSYAVKAKYRIMEYLDQKAVVDEAKRLAQLQEDLHKLAQQNAQGPFPLPDRIPLKQLAAPMDQFQGAKRLLGPNDTATIKSDQLGDHDVDLGADKKPSDYIQETGENVTSGTMEMVLLVRKPDFLGNSLWEFRHAKTPIMAHIQDEKWLDRFRNGLETILPGSSMVCSVDYRYEYGKDGALLSATHEIATVHRVVHPDGGKQADMLEE